MRKIIAGRRYDTETADEVSVGGSPGHVSVTDFHYYEEALYRTRKGTWFLAGHGGPLSRYSHAAGNGFTSGEGIRPLSDREARAWLEAHNDVEALEKYFADEIEDA